MLAHCGIWWHRSGIMMVDDGAKLLNFFTLLALGGAMLALWWHYDYSNFDFIQLCSRVMTDGGVMVALQWTMMVQNFYLFQPCCHVMTAGGIMVVLCWIMMVQTLILFSCVSV